MDIVAKLRGLPPRPRCHHGSIASKCDTCGLEASHKRVEELEAKLSAQTRAHLWERARHWRVHHRLVRRIEAQRKQIAKLHELRKQDTQP